MAGVAEPAITAKAKKAKTFFLNIERPLVFMGKMLPREWGHINPIVFQGPSGYWQSMPLHMIKLCVGCESLAELADWQKKRLKEKRAKGQKPELIHITRMTPKRADEILEGGSLYWVIKGQIAARQKLLAFREVKKNGIPHCGLVYDKALVPVVARPRRAFQGWRYLESKDAPPDLAQTKGARNLPEALQRELAALGLL